VQTTDGLQLIRARGLGKVFDGVTVLHDADLEVGAGEIHALVGANGSGKSTLIKLLSGYHFPSAGQVDLVPDPQTGVAPQLAFVHQDLALVDSMSVLENVALSCGYPTGPMRRVRWREMRKRVAELLAEFDLDVDPLAEIGTLGGTERRLIAIARATYSLGGDRGVLILDEPTAALPPDEVHRVFDVMRVVARRGCGVLFVCHNLEETLTVAHRVTVLRNGGVVALVDAKDVTVDALAEKMFGAVVDEVLHEGADSAAPPARAIDRSGTPALSLQGVTSTRLRDVDIDVAPGEVVGITGLVGCGKSELARVLAGSQPMKGGTISVHGRAYRRFRSPRAALGAGISYVPPDRRRSGGVLTMDARENVTLSTVEEFVQGGRLRKRRELRSVAEQMVVVGAVPARPRQAFAAFSGGNQQKLVLARVLRIKPRVVVLDEPTQGVDVETIPELYRFIRLLADEGCAVLVISSDLEEIVEVSDRVAVMQDARAVAELTGNEITVERVGTAVARGRRDEAS
jgi:ribose transport system ATP-binding protein